MTFTTSQRYQGGIACRDGHAAAFERETGRSWYSHISHGRPRRKKTHLRKGQAARPVFLPVTVFSPGKEGGVRMTN